MILSVIGLILGSWGMGSRLIFGHASVNYGSYVPWGLWVVFYLFFRRAHRRGLFDHHHDLYVSGGTIETDRTSFGLYRTGGPGL